MQNSFEKIKMIPGWMRPVSFYNCYDGIEIWKGRFDLNNKIDAEYIIGFSIGANAALINWNQNRNAKLILINPLIPKRSLLSWFFRWIKFALTEGPKVRAAVSLRYLISAIGTAIKILKVDPLEIIEKIPKKQLLIICGSDDDYFFDKKTQKCIRALGIMVKEVEGAGHDWNEGFEDTIKEYIKQKNM